MISGFALHGFRMEDWTEKRLVGLIKTFSSAIDISQFQKMWDI